MKHVLDLYCQLLRILLTVLMGLMLVPVTLQIISRYTDGYIPRYIWTEEASRFCFVWIIMIGSMVAVRDGTHFDVDLLPAPKSKRDEGFANLIVHVCMMVMAVVFAWFGMQFAKFGSIQTSEMSGINMLGIYIAFPIAGFSWALFLIEKLVADWKLITGDDSETQS